MVLCVALVSGCVESSLHGTYACEDDDRIAIVLHPDGTFTFDCDAAPLWGEYEIINDKLYLKYTSFGTPQAFVFSIVDGDLVASGGSVWVRV